MAEELVRALHDYQPTEEGCLTLKQGDLIKVIQKDKNGWWMGVCQQQTGLSNQDIYMGIGKSGIFTTN